MRATAVSAVFMAIMMVALLGLPLVATAQNPGQDTLIVGVQNDTPNLAPWDIATNSVWKAFLWENWVYENLYTLNPDGSSTYATLADGDPIVNTPDGLNVTVHIRQGITFTDGQPMDATDVVFSYQTFAFNSQLSDRVLKAIVWPNPTYTWWNATTTAWGATHFSHTGIIKIDQYTVKLVLRQPYSMFYFGTLPTPIMPSHIWKNHMATVDLAAFTLPDGAALLPGTEFDFDRNFGSQPSDVQATIGTGPWYLESWQRLSGATLKIYQGYWGKAESINFQGKDYPFFPINLRTIQFKVYGTLDVAVLAMKSGEVHVVPWSLPIGFYNDLKKDPRMGFKISASDGFYYLSFNMRKAPMNDLNFRRAVSMVIDKGFIVDRLLAGFGIRGEVPVSPINPGYINSSALTPSFDLNLARTTLDSAGYHVGSDGWRTMPDGSPLKLSILTPAKDYDPTRADAGIMISNNLKAIGLNIDSAPTAFDAIVSAVFVAIQFDMYILGWVNLGPFPELYLSDFFGCNSFVPNGDNTPGFCDKAGMEKKLSILDSSMDDAARIQAAKDAEGILTTQLPYNTLYISRQIEGYRADIWGGWVPINGEIFNAFSFGILGPPGENVPSGPLSISLNMPGQAVAGTTVPFQIYAVQGGAPASGVFVNVTASTGDYYNVTTGSDGFATLPFKLPYVGGEVSFIASAKKGSDTGGDIASMNIVLPNDVAQLALSTNTPVVGPAGTATVTAKVTDRSGAAIANAPISIIKQLVLGSVTPDNATTDATGTATFTYTAPVASLIPNRNQFDFIKANVNVPSKPKVPDVNAQTLAMGVESTVSDWYLLNINAPTTMVIGTSPPYSATTAITVKLTKQDGSVVQSEPVTASFNSTAISVDQATKNTDALGQATFTFTALTGTSTAIPVNFTVSRAFSAMSGLCLLVTDGVTRANATYMTIASKFNAPNTAVSVTLHVVDEHGNPENNAQVNIFIPYNTAGNPVSVSGPEWAFFGSVGSLFTGMTGVGGTATASFNTKTFPGDNVIMLETSVGVDLGPFGNFQVNGLKTHAKTYFYEQTIQQRNKLAAVSTITMAPVLMTPAGPIVNVTATFKDDTGPIQGLNAALYRGKGDLRPGKGATQICAAATDVNGQIKCQWTEPSHVIDTAAPFTAIYTDTNYALGGQIGSSPFEAIFPYLMTAADPDILVPTGAPASTIVALGSPQTYNIKVVDFFNNNVQSAKVTGSSSPGGPATVTATTIGTGQASLQLIPGTSSTTDTTIWETTFTITLGTKTTTIQFGTMVGVGTYAYSNLNVPSSATVGKSSTITVDVNNTGPVRDTAYVVLNMDGNFYAAQQVTIDPNAKVTVTFTYVPSDTNSHSFSVSSLSGSVTAGGAGGADMVVTAGVGVVLLIVGVIIGFFIGKMGKKPKPEETVTETPPTPPAQ